MFQFTVRETFTDAPINLLSWISDFLVTEQGGKRFLYSASRPGGGVIAFDITAGMVLVEQLPLPVGAALSAPPSLDLVSFGGRDRLVVSGTNQATLLTYRIDAGDPIGQIARPEGGPAGVVSAQEMLTIGAQSFVYAATTNSGAVSAYAMAADGTLTLLQSLTLGPTLQGLNIADLQQFQIGSARFLAAALPGEDAFALMRIAADGRLTELGRLGAAQGLGINGPSALQSIVAHGVGYLLVSAGPTSSLSVVEVAADGTMTLRDHVMDTLATRFQGVQAFDSFTANGRSFVVIGGGDAGLDLLEILPGGRLVWLAQILDTPATTMAGISAIHASVRGSRVDIFVAGEGAGITRLALDLSKLAAPLIGGNGADSLTGGANDDLIWGGGGADVLSGGAGDDVISDGAGSDTMTGGAGRDIFVLSADGQRDVITDFQPGIDRIDLSAWGRIYDLSALSLVSTANGATISFGNEVLEVFSANGLPLRLADFRDAGMLDLWHNVTQMAARDSSIHGTAGHDDITGTPEDDRFIESAGNDTIRGGGGNDTVVFSVASGTILVSGSAAQIVVTSSLGIDTYSGISSFEFTDRVMTLAQLVALIPTVPVVPPVTGPTEGNDTLTGTAGNDSIDALGGHDSVTGLAGNDTLYGGAGNDSLYGGDGEDVLIGGAGADRLDGGAGGRDRAEYSDATAGLRADLQRPQDNTGFAAGDTYFGIEDLGGSGFADTLLGDAGANLLFGGAGADALHGREGNDTLYGGDGDDVLVGGAGADLLDGGAGARDRAEYSDSTAGLHVDLQRPQDNTGIAAGDSFVGIEDLTGSAYADTLLGDGGANMLVGAAGNDILQGREGNDSLYGGDGDDVLIGGAGADRLEGGAGARDRADYSDATLGLRADLQRPQDNTGIAAGDSYFGIEGLSGSGFADTLTGDAGNNLILGGGGNDSLYGGVGDDTLTGGAGADRLDGGAGARDMADYSDATSAVRVELAKPRSNTGFAAGDIYVGIEDLSGSAYGDTLLGNSGANIILGLGGNDLLQGLAGNDSLYGGDGNDTLTGGAGADLLDGGAGARDRADYSDSKSGLRADLLRPQNNTGDAKGDVYFGIEDIAGTSKADTLLGDAGVNMIFGGAGNDELQGREGDDSLYGGDGNDTLTGGAGADLLDGAAGARDRADYSDSPIGLRVDLQRPQDNTGFAAGDIYVGIEDISGSVHGDTLLGDAGANMIYGGDGNDRIFGRAGNDTLYGGAGDDTLTGGLGADRLEGGAGRDMADYSDAVSAIRVELTKPRSNTGLAAGDTYSGIEDISGGIYGDTLLGDAAANMIFGVGGNDLLQGLAGNDSLYGGDGDDTLIGGAGADRLDGGAGARDRADYSDSTAGLRADLQRPQSNTGFAAGDSYFGIEDLIGTSKADTLLGDDGSNMIFGGAGNDELQGREGDDSLYGDAGNDVLMGGAGADLLDGGAGARDRADYSDSPIGLRVDLQRPQDNTGFAAGDSYVGIEDLSGSAYGDTLLGDAGVNMIYGGAGDDLIFGRAGNDTLQGGAGNDTLHGGAGNDQLFGGAGADVFVFDTMPGTGNVDAIADFVPADDTIWLDDAIFSALSPGALPAAAFLAGATATTSAHRILYSKSGGQLFYDPDGNGPAAKILFATVKTSAALTAADFLIV